VNRVCIINVVGLTPELLEDAPNLNRLAQTAGWQAQPWRSPLPAVTATSQATMLTGLAPREHGIVGNGWYFRDTQEVRFWQQANSLIQGRPFYDDFETAKMFWWFNQSSSAKWSATPKPHYGCDGSKIFDILDQTDCELTRKLGPFPFFNFWGPHAGLPASQWIANATALVLREKQPQVTLTYLPHLDYDFQRFPNHDSARVAEVDACAAVVLDAADSINAQPLIVSEYGLAPVHRPVHLNRVLRLANCLHIRSGPFGEMLIPGESAAFSVADHQLAHVYVRDKNRIGEIRELLETVPGIARVVRPAELELDHPRSGELIVLAETDSWFTYYYWLDDTRAPDFSRTVDIHRKPGYDPVELFMTSKTRAMRKLLRKKLGFRYSMDVIPLDANLIQGSHGLHPENPNKGPMIIGPGIVPDDMRGFANYVRAILVS
jgi:predicted AlkP superfamily pyrophosphatase or phosphodiesterase